MRTLHQIYAEDMDLQPQCNTCQRWYCFLLSMLGLDVRSVLR